MPRVVQVVVTDGFAGVERYVANTATELGRRGWEVAVVGGSPSQMPLVIGPDVRWMPGSTPPRAIRSLAAVGRRDVCHVHMTLAEAAALAGWPFHRAPIVSTRHFARRRGSSPLAKAMSPILSTAISRELAAGQFIAGKLERPPAAVLANGVPESELLWRVSNRTVLVLQRLAPEKDTFTALRAWREARLWEEGWSMRIVGDGSERTALEDWARHEHLAGVTFTGWLPDVANEIAEAGMLLAPAPAEPFGLGVLEAMSAGVPVVACAGGGHLETVGLLADAPLFPPHDAGAAAAVLRAMLADESRLAASDAGRKLVDERFTLERHVDQLLVEYEALASGRRSSRGLA